MTRHVAGEGAPVQLRRAGAVAVEEGSAAVAHVEDVVGQGAVAQGEQPPRAGEGHPRSALVGLATGQGGGVGGGAWGVGQVGLVVEAEYDARVKR